MAEWGMDPASIKRACMIAASSPTDHLFPGASWQKALREAFTDPADLLRELGLGGEFLEPARRAAALFGLKVPRSFVGRMHKGDPRDPLLMQVLPLEGELVNPVGFL